MKILRRGRSPEAIDLTGAKLRGMCSKCRTRCEADGSELRAADWRLLLGHRAVGNCPVCDSLVVFYKSRILPGTLLFCVILPLTSLATLLWVVWR